MKARTTEVIETAKKKKAAKRRPQQKADQQKRTGGRTDKPTEETKDKRAGKATKVQTAAGQHQKEESKKSAAEQQEEESKRAAAEQQEEENRIYSRQEKRAQGEKETEKKGDKENEDNAKQARTSRAESPAGRRKGNKGRTEATEGILQATLTRGHGGSSLVRCGECRCWSEGESRP